MAESTEKSYFDTLESHFYVDADTLLANVIIASKGKSGEIDQIELKPELRSSLAREKKITAETNRADREKKRLSRKRLRAAKRDREREEVKLAFPLLVARLVAVCPSRWTVRIGHVQDADRSAERSRSTCSKERKTWENTLSMKADAGGAVAMQVIAKRARRAKARKTAVKVGLSSHSADNKLSTQPLVTATSGACLESSSPYSGSPELQSAAGVSNQACWLQATDLTISQLIAIILGQ
ncbi:hypothetical protein PAXINDRAFT_156788 [Paxillus involutus ATCC 200175]|uniref:Uncharacterized protein n=1 Tax=Paxillus involutus ATCC 200175 TaxID=664439 RepID=A0A0C9TB70_PAXIN|nr:hypothetical protein PAXINDRAFT_156788 [Paxillus involutus ATCC 200175]